MSEPASSLVPGTINVDLTDAAGWHYTCSFPYPTVTYEFSTDISTSPPGSARLGAAMVGSFDGFDPCPNDNPGRTTDPLTPDFHLSYDASWLGDDVGTILSTGDGCENGGGPYATADNDAFPKFFICKPGVPGASGALEQDETDVNAWVAKLSAEKPTIVISLTAGFFDLQTQCQVFVDATGEVGRASEYTDESCGTLVLTVA